MLSLKSFMRAVAIAMTASLIAACGQSSNQAEVTEPKATAAQSSAALQLIDANATRETQALYRNLDKIRHTKTLFGHQDTLAYGVEWVDEADRSDIRDMTGANPAVYGWDLGGIEIGRDSNLDNVKFDDIERWIKLAYQRGAINTISWHTYNANTGGISWDLTPVIADLLPGGAKHDTFKAYLDKIAEFNSRLVATDEAGNSHAIPIVFRPWHEHNGDWFFWGKGHITEQQYIELWRFTVDYLKDEKGINNFIWAYSPDRSRMSDDFEASYFYGYPGDDYVDVIGLDNYWDMGHAANPADAQTQLKALTASLKGIVKIAEAKNKVPALTEGGNNQLLVDNFFTERLLAGITADEEASRIAWVLVWRNANTIREKRENDLQFFAPYPGHAQEADFKKFYESPAILFEDGLPNMYQ